MTTIDMSHVPAGASFTAANGKVYVKKSERAKRSGCTRCDFTPLWIAVNPETSRIVLIEKDGTPHFMRCTKAGEGRAYGSPRVSLPASPAVAITDDPFDGPVVPATGMPASAGFTADDVRRMLAEMLASSGLPGMPAAAAKPEAPKPVVKAARLRIPAGDSWALMTAAASALPRVILYGPPGTGKTHLAMTAGLADGEPVYRVNMTEDTPAAELRGHYVPTGDGWHWHDGPAMAAFRNGGRLVVDEITRAADDALSFMLAVLDGHPITLPSGETVERHPEFSCWATTNDDPTALSDALADRFTVRQECKQVNPEALASLPAHIRSSVGTATGNISFREAQEYSRLTDDPVIAAIAAATGRDIAAQLVWEARGRDVTTAFKLAAAGE